MADKKLPWWRPTVKTGVHILCALPLLYLGWLFYADKLGVNPIEADIRYLGDWALRFLLIALAVTPLRKLTRRPRIGQFRRMLGLWAFAYVMLHVLSFVVLDQFFDWQLIGHEIAKNKFIMMGMAAFTLMVPLAVTSTNKMVRRIGARRWNRLHKLIYFAGICASIHYIWMVKANIVQPMIYLAILMVLLGLRLFWTARDRMVASAATA